MSKKHWKVCTVLNYIEHLFIVVSMGTLMVSMVIFQFLPSLVSIPIGIAFCSRIEKLKIC